MIFRKENLRIWSDIGYGGEEEGSIMDDTWVSARWRCHLLRLNPIRELDLGLIWDILSLRCVYYT